MARRRRNNAECDVIEQLNADGWTVHTRGWPDLLCVHADGRVRFVEVKSHRSGGLQELSKAQEAVHAILKGLGLDVETIWSESGGIHVTERQRERKLERAVEKATMLRGQILGDSGKVIVEKLNQLWQRQYHSDSASLARGEVTVTVRGSRMLVAAPFNEQFRLGARAILGHQWKASIRVWSFPMSELAEVRELIDHVFGYQHVPEWMRRHES